MSSQYLWNIRIKICHVFTQQLLYSLARSSALMFTKNWSNIVCDLSIEMDVPSNKVNSVVTTHRIFVCRERHSTALS